MLKSLQRVLLLSVLIMGGLFVAYQGFMFWHAQDKLPPGVTIGGVEVAGLTAEQAHELLTETFLGPIVLIHRDERVELDPAQVGFTVDIDGMVEEAVTLSEPDDPFLAFFEFVMGRSLSPVDVELRATHDRDLLIEQLDELLKFMDKPATGPRFVEQTETFVMGNDGYVTDLDASLPAIEDVLYAPDNREVALLVVDEAARPFEFSILHEMIQEDIEGFGGMGSIFIMDLQTGEEISINADVALSGLSVVKVAIMLETYRAIDGEPNFDQQKLLEETAVHSGNFSANLLLDVVAGQDNAYLGSDILTESMQKLGLENTFIVTPYEEPNRPEKTTMTTPANSRTDINTFPDPTMQTTAEDMGTLLSMLYYCAKGGGTLLAVYPGEITPEECQSLIDLMALNVEGNLIRFGVPEEVKVSHKHGWATNTHGDAGIVYSPAGDYIIVEYLTDPETDWLNYETSFPLLREVSRTVYNFFNRDDPYFEDPIEAIIEAEEASATATATAAEGETEAQLGNSAETDDTTSDTDAPTPEADPTPSPTPTPQATPTVDPNATPEPPGIEA